MRVLAVDTSFEACSAAILDGEKVLWLDQRVIGRGHSEVLPVIVAAGLEAAGLNVSDFDRIGVVIGPGAFAGVRVGLAFARALCLGMKAKAVGVNSLKALAASVEKRGLIAPVFDARRGQVYAALYNASLEELIEPFVAVPAEASRRLSAEGAERLILAGSGAPLIGPYVSAPFETSPVSLIHPVAVARLAMSAALPSSPPAPLYLRPPDAAPSAGGLFNRLAEP